MESNPTDLLMKVKPNYDLEHAVRNLIWTKYEQHPRSLQVELGPSEIGEPCVRRLAYNAVHHRCSDGTQHGMRLGDPLPSVVGTAAHTWMEDACRLMNEAAGRTVWLPESTVNVEAGLNGHSDAYNADLHTVVDWKFPGPDRMKKYRAEGPSDIYRIQAHLYGKGFVRLGFIVRNVAIVFLPRGGMLRHMHVWQEPYNESVADEALARYHTVRDTATQLDCLHHPERFKVFPKRTSHECQNCNWFKPAETDEGGTCPGYSLED